MFERFHYRTLDELQEKLAELGIEWPVSDDLSILAEPLQIGPKAVPNRLAIHPMEGCDCGTDGAPGELTRRRYRRFAAGGAGLIWCEACAVVPEGRANPHQMMLSEQNVGKFARLLEECRALARQSMGSNHEPVFICQLTHSGRHSRPEGKPAPIIAHHAPELDRAAGLPADYPLIADEELDRLQEAYLQAALLAQQAGFDGVDVKACHGYLVAELLASFTRPGGRYGGPEFENRTRFVREVHARIAAELPELIVTSRMNTYDPLPYPYGWGADRDDYRQVDLAEPLRLAAALKEQGAPCLNVTVGNPYYHPHYNRPFDFPIEGAEPPDEHPLAGVARMLGIAREIQARHTDLPVVGTGYTYLREFMPYFAAGMLRDGWASAVGVGRQAFAYPGFAGDILQDGGMDRFQCCISCSRCTQLMRDGEPSGCVVRDSEVYAPLHREGRRHAPDTIAMEAARCRICVAATCQVACPAGVDVPGFVRAVADGDLRRAYDVLRAANPLPELCSYICPVEVQCEGACVEGIISGRPVPIRDIQRYVCRLARADGRTALRIPDAGSERRFAVVGAGPAGVACACYLLERGHSVTIIDAAEAPGGVARRTIPGERLDASDADAELQSILTDAPEQRLTWRFGTTLGKDTSLDELLAAHDAVLLATGLTGSVSLMPEGRQVEGVRNALEFLHEMKKNPQAAVPKRVAVLGGGNTALDAALTAKHRGAEDVFLLYRRSFEEMPAWPAERDTAVRHGVHFLILTQPVNYEADARGRLIGVRTVRTVLGEPDASGRRRPEQLPDSAALLPANMAIEALGQRLPDELLEALPGVEPSEQGLIAVDPETMQTTRKGVFAAGDIVNGGATAVRAVAEGLRAARAMDGLLQPGQDR